MKALFVGPSLYGTTPDLRGIEVKGPAAQGDIARAVLDGAVAIGLVDGAFGEVAAVWHKEILFALSRGVRVLGAASMGALRAAECRSFGMRPIGEIATAYADGRLDDDAAVAVVHAPAELGYEPLSEALVDALATIDELSRLGIVTTVEREALRQGARRLFFADRTPLGIVAAAALLSRRGEVILGAYLAHRLSVKRADALLLVEELRITPELRGAPPEWEFQKSASWVRLLSTLEAAD